jgi:hypothetical protein
VTGMSFRRLLRTTSRQSAGIVAGSYGAPRKSAVFSIWGVRVVSVCAVCGYERTPGPWCLHCGAVKTRMGTPTDYSPVAFRQFVSSIRTAPALGSESPTETSAVPATAIPNRREWPRDPEKMVPEPRHVWRQLVPMLRQLSSRPRQVEARRATIAVVTALTVGISAVAVIHRSNDEKNSDHAAPNTSSSRTQPSSSRTQPSSSRTQPSSRPSARPARSPSTEATNPISTPSTAKPGHIEPQPDALTQLRSIRAHDLRMITFDGKWVARLAAKIPGITDSLQTTASGSHTFTLSDILDEYQRARKKSDFGKFVLLLQSTDYGTRERLDGQPYWVTVVALPRFSSARDVTDWCVQEYPQLSPYVRRDFCVARRLDPPTGSP